MIFNDPDVFASAALCGRQFQTPAMVHMIESVLPCACPGSTLSFRWGNSLGITTTKETFSSVLITVTSGCNQEIHAAARHLMTLYIIFFSNWVTLYINLQSISIHFKSLLVLEPLAFWMRCFSLTAIKSPTRNVVFPRDEDANGLQIWVGIC